MKASSKEITVLYSTVIMPGFRSHQVFVQASSLLSTYGFVCILHVIAPVFFCSAASQVRSMPHELVL